VRQSYADQVGSGFWSLPRPLPARQINVGSLRLDRDEIVGCRIEDVVERDTAGKIATLGLFFAAALVLLLGLVEFSWAMRLLLVGIVLAVIAAASCMEALGISSVVYYRLDILLRDGRSVGYTTADRADAVTLAAQLGKPISTRD